MEFISINYSRLKPIEYRQRLNIQSFLKHKLPQQLFKLRYHLDFNQYAILYNEYKNFLYEMFIYYSLQFSYVNIGQKSNDLIFNYFYELRKHSSCSLIYFYVQDFYLLLELTNAPINLLPPISMTLNNHSETENLYFIKHFEIHGNVNNRRQTKIYCTRALEILNAVRIEIVQDIFRETIEATFEAIDNVIVYEQLTKQLTLLCSLLEYEKDCVKHLLNKLKYNKKIKK